MFVGAALAISLVFILATLAIWALIGEKISDYTRDPNAVAAVDPFVGFLSNIGVMIWTVAASVAGFSALALRHLGAADAARFFAAACGLSAFLAFDDLFQLHETVLPTLLRLPEPIIVLAYAALAGWFVVRFHRILLGQVPRLFGLSCLFLGSSIGADLFLELNRTDLRDWSFLVEDGLKVTGIVGWAAMIGRLSFVQLLAVAEQATKSLPEPARASMSNGQPA